ncbi:MAG: hypothetical protein HYV92_04145 [Candidatus Rokubacteria bacterium]|nr:hypothetical protein [Candidatus Rokubacteria bacterium]MBI2553614.1 hypothetical protein [Candidatus Rokubacteria bacterium]
MIRFPQRVLGLLTAGLFAAYLVALSPHLVHHLFDQDDGVPACPHLAQSQQNPGVQPDPPSLPHLIATGALDAPLPSTSLPSLDLTAGRPRAPPSSAPSV